MELVQETIRETMIVRAFCIAEVKDVRRNTLLNSSRGIVWVLSGATFDRAVRSRVQAWLSGLVVRR